MAIASEASDPLPAPGGVAIDAGVSAPVLEVAPPLKITQFQFTASGNEYFRIWVVNTLLTLLTLGAYSAWAKVRKTRYFWQNTQLDGYAFDYHARPWPILRGRVLALVLFFAYSWSLDFSRTGGLIMIVALCVVGPWLFLKSQQFKLANTSWRGLRFNFESRLSDAYRRLLPVLLLWFSSTVAAMLFAETPTLILVTSTAVLVFWPWMHHRLKAYQHGCATWGNLHASFAPSKAAFYKTYLLAMLLMFAVAIPAGIVVGMGSALLQRQGASASYMIVIGILAILLSYLLAGPYFATRLQQRVWSATQFGPVRFHTRIKAFGLMRLAFVNGLLTLLTLGLYWPYAAVALARYRIECMQLESPTELGEATSGVQRRALDATGDGALDAFGLDIGL